MASIPVPERRPPLKGAGRPAPPPDRVLRDSVAATFRQICGADPVYEGESDEPAHCNGVLGIIAVVGDISWSLTLGLPADTAVRLAHKFSGFSIPFDSPDMSDVVGELANVLAGDVTARLAAAGIDVNMSLPTVAHGTNLCHSLPSATLAMRLKFQLPQGPLWLGLAVGEQESVRT